MTVLKYVRIMLGFPLHFDEISPILFTLKFSNDLDKLVFNIRELDFCFAMSWPILFMLLAQCKHLSGKQ